MLPCRKGFHRCAVAPRIRQELAGFEVPGSQQVGDAPVVACNHAAGRGPVGANWAVFDAVFGAPRVEPVASRSPAAAKRSVNALPLTITVVAPQAWSSSPSAAGACM